MFLAGEPAQCREAKIRKWLHTEPSIALLVAAVHFEWTICRAVLFLSPRPNREIRKEVAAVYCLEKYKDFWRMEIVSLRGGHSLPRIVDDWKAVTDAFKARDRLVHGRDRYTRNMAAPHVEALLKAAAEIREYCKHLAVDFQARLPIRKKISEQSNKGMEPTRRSARLMPGVSWSHTPESGLSQLKWDSGSPMHQDSGMPGSVSAKRASGCREARDASGAAAGASRLIREGERCTTHQTPANQALQRTGGTALVPGFGVQAVLRGGFAPAAEFGR